MMPLSTRNRVISRRPHPAIAVQETDGIASNCACISAGARQRW